MQTEAQNTEKKPDKPQEAPPKSDKDRYKELQDTPVHKRTAQDNVFFEGFSAKIAIERHHGALISKITDKVTTFKNAECVRIRRRITDEVAKLAPIETAATQDLQQKRKVELKDLEKIRRQALKALNDQYDSAAYWIKKRLDATIEAARKDTQDKYKQYEVDLGDAIGEVTDQSCSFIDLINTFSTEQLEDLLAGKTVEVEAAGIKDHVVLPGV